MTHWFYVTMHNCVMWALSIWTLFSHIHCHSLVAAENTFLNAFTNLNSIICHCFCVDENVKIMKLLMGRLCTQIFVLVIFYKLNKFSSSLLYTSPFLLQFIFGSELLLLFSTSSEFDKMSDIIRYRERMQMRAGRCLSS